MRPYQTQAQGAQTKITTFLASGVTTGAWLHLPDDYNTTSTTYPLLIFLHGVGEGGTDVNAVLAHGVPKMIANGANMNFTVGGKVYKFIVVSPQITNGWASEGMVQSVINDIKSKYRVDANRIYLTGLSAGAYGVLNYVASGTTYSNNLAAIVPVSPAAIDNSKISGLCNVAASNIAMWGLCGTADPFIDNQTNYVKDVNGCNPKIKAIATSYPGNAHDDGTWDKAYDVGHTYQSPNIYEWMLQYSKNGATTTAPAAVASVANANITITLPTSTISLDGSKSSNAVSYAWTYVSGPVKPAITTATSATTNVTGLTTAGSYVFTLTVKNGDGVAASTNVNVVVNAASVPAPIAQVASDNLTITLPTSTVTLDGSASTNVSSYAWSMASGPATATIATPAAAATVVSGLKAGSYVFNLIVKNSAGVSAQKQVSVTVNNAATSSGGGGNTGTGGSGSVTCSFCKFLIKPGSDGGAYIDGSTMNVKPGDTVCVQSGNYSYIQFFNFTGSSAKPIVFINCGGVVKVGNGGNYGLIFNNVKYFKVTGSGSSDKYGFVIDGVSKKLNTGMAMGKGCTDYEAERTEITGSEVGLMAKVNPDCDPANQYPNFAIRNVKLHDLYIHETTGEGMYIGNTAPNGTEVTCTDGSTMNALPPRIYNLEIYNVITQNTGWDGIQVASAPQNVLIHDNSVNNYGTTNMGSQQAGIILGGESNGKVYNNKIIKGTGNGIEVFGTGLCQVYNNILFGCGIDGTSTGQDAIFIDDRPTTYNYVPLQVYVLNNTVINSGRDAIRMQNSFGTDGKGNLFENNLLVTPGSLSVRGVLSYLTVQAGIDNISNGNLTYADITLPKFVSVSGNDYHLTSGSPAIDKGLNLSAYFKYDIDNNTRPQGAAFDVGADEYASGTSTNKAPTANAGAAQTITLPVSTVTLNGSASSDADGSITSYKWSEVSGPATANYSSTTIAQPVITNLVVAGTYTFQLLVTDNSGATSTATVAITVKPAVIAANKPPVASAGAAQTITLPTSSVTLDASGSTDPDGTVASYKWVQSSGPVTAAFSSATASKPVASSLTTAGTYVFQVTVTDNSGATANASVTITVNSAVTVNKAPVANAGNAQTITLPTSSVTLDGTASTDADGSIISYVWSQVSGPIAGSLTNATSSKAAVSALTTAGTYVFQLLVKDNAGATSTATVTITVKPAGSANVAPTANAGTAQTITLPTSTVTLDGSASKDSDGSIASYLWKQTAGPASSVITSTTSAKPVITNLTVAGTYTLQLTVTDNKGATGTASVTITVKPAPAANKPPVASTSAVTITLPTTTATLDGSLSYDTDGSITAYSWTQTSGPATAAIATPTAVKTAVSKLTVAGTYIFKLVVTDNSGATDDVQTTITVLPASGNSSTPPANKAPVANAGADLTVTMPRNTTTVSGAASTDADGKIVSYKWTQVSGPSTASIPSSTSAVTDLNQLTAVGVYVFRLTVTDDKGASATDDVNVTILPNPDNKLVADAGNDQTITLPTVNIATLDGTGSSEPGGYISSYQWEQVSGPSGSLAATILNPVSSTPAITFNTAGTYVFRLTVTDTYNNTATSEVTVYVISKLGTADQTQIAVTAYPNPAVSTIHLKLSLAKAATLVVRIYNSNGAIKGTYYQGTVSNIDKDFDVSSLSAGLYFMEITDGQTMQLSQKFIKVQ
jgi:poly(3-hydroxybutyrate) depolymerase